MLIGWGSWSQRAARVAPLAEVEVSSLTGRTRSHPRIRNFPYLYNSKNPETKTVIPPVDTAPHGMETPAQGAPLLIGVREASGPHPMGVRSSASSFSVIKY